MSHAGVAQRLDAVLANIAVAARDVGRAPADVTLIAVSKTFDAPDIEPVLAAGQRVRDSQSGFRVCDPRLLVRMREVFESVRIIRQCLDKMPKGPVLAERSKAAPPRRARWPHPSHPAGRGW